MSMTNKVSLQRNIEKLDKNCLKGTQGVHPPKGRHSLYREAWEHMITGRRNRLPIHATCGVNAPPILRYLKKN